MGIDDLLAAWGPDKVLALFDNATPTTELVRKTPSNYREKDGSLVRYKSGYGDSIEEVALTNFTARIATNIIEDDGVETRRQLGIVAHSQGRRFSFTVPVSSFSRMDWALEHIGPGAIVYPNQRDYARTAIQSLSLDVEEQRVFTHTGWREHEGRWFYLHSGGAIDGNGHVPGVNVQLSGPLARYEISLPKEAEVLKTALEASLRLLDLGPVYITFPLLAATYRAAIKAADFGIWLVGPTGVFKTEVAALSQQHFGPAMNSRNLPANFASTANALEMWAFHAKDALLVVDDFAPHGGTSDIRRYHGVAERLFRGAGNSQGRGRLRSDITIREAQPPRGLIVATGEDVPREQSVRARALILEVAKGDVNTNVLTECQEVAASGLLTEAMGGFIRWLADHYDESQVRFRQTFAKLRAQASSLSAHTRTPGIVADLQLGFELYLDFALESRAITEERKANLSQQCWSALCHAAKAQRQQQDSSDPARRFVELLSGALASGQAHAANLDGSRPDRPYFWARRFTSTGPNVDWEPKGRLVGWVDDNGLYLEPEASLSVVHRMAREIDDPLTVSPTTLRRRLKDKGYLASCDIKRQVLTVRKTVAGCKKNLLHLRLEVILDGVGSSSADVGSMSSGAAEPDTSFPYGSNELRGNVGNVGFSSGGDGDGENQRGPSHDLVGEEVFEI